MAATARFTIGTGASCSGEVSRMAAGPVTRLMPGPKHRRGLRRLVPLVSANPAAGLDHPG